LDDAVSRLASRNGTGWIGLQAGDINNQCIIVGTGNLNGARRGFVAIPVTQP